MILIYIQILFGEKGEFFGARNFIPTIRCVSHLYEMFFLCLYIFVFYILIHVYIRPPYH